jgi:hypothetical protein
MTARQQNVDQLVGAFRAYVQALMTQDQGGIGIHESVTAVQQNLRDALRSAFGIEEHAP